MAWEQALQTIKTDAGQNRHQQGVMVNVGCCCGDRINLLRLDGKQLHGSRPDLQGLRTARGVNRHGLEGPLSQTLGRAGEIRTPDPLIRSQML